MTCGLQDGPDGHVFVSDQAIFIDIFLKMFQYSLMQFLGHRNRKEIFGYKCHYHNSL